MDAAMLPDAVVPMDVARIDARADASVDAPVDAPVDADGGACVGSGRSLCTGTCVVHGSNPAMCSQATDLGAFCGDTSCGTLCPATRYRSVITRTGRSSMWFRARANECSYCSANLVARVNLTVPAGVNYDLFVYRPCGTVVRSSSAGPGQPDSVEITETDTPTLSDSFEYFIEVRYLSGASCTPWTLTLEARSNGGTSC